MIPPVPDLDPTGSSPRPRWWLGLLSAAVPGLGHLVARRIRLGLLFLVPIVTLVGAGVVAAKVDGPLAVGGWFADPAVLGGLLVLEAAILLWRILAVVSSLQPRRARWRPVDAVPAVLLAFVVVVPQLWAGALTAAARQASEQVFSGADAGAGVWQPSPSPDPSPSAAASAAGAPPSAVPSPSPSPSPSPLSGRITVLLLGVDLSLALTDTMIVASLDPVGHTVSMLSIPRDMVDVPLPDGRIYHQKLNSLRWYASTHPAEFPGSKGNGYAVLVGTISHLIGIPIEYWAQLDFNGLIKMVDSVGGVDVTVAKPLCDPTFDTFGFKGFSLGAGRVHLDGVWALVYARIRHPIGESDFTRAKRQQDVILAIRTAALRGGILNDPFGFISALGDSLRTDVPPSLLPSLLPFAAGIGPRQVYRVTLIPPRSIAEGYDSRGYIIEPNIPRIRDLAAALFPAVGRLPVTTAADTLPPADTSTAVGSAPTPAPSCPSTHP